MSWDSVLMGKNYWSDIKGKHTTTTLSLSLSLSLCLSLSLSRTRTHTHKHTQTHTVAKFRELSKVEKQDFNAHSHGKSNRIRYQIIY
jgi:hypothetical protein